MTRTGIPGRRDRSARRQSPITSQGRGTGLFEVVGLTCGRCVGVLMDALLDLPGTTAVRIEPTYGGVSLVELTGPAPDAPIVRSAVRHAGFGGVPASPPRTARQRRYCSSIRRRSGDAGSVG